MMARKQMWMALLLLTAVVLGASLASAYVDEGDGESPCDPPPSNNCQWYENFGYYVRGDTCKRTCSWSWTKALAGSTCSIAGQCGSHWGSLPVSVTSLSDNRVECLIDHFTTSQLLQLSPERLADNLHQISDLGIFAGSPSLSQKFNDALILKFGFKDDFQFTFGEDVTGGITMQESGVLNHNGQHVLLSTLTDLDGIVLMQWENEITEDITYGFRFILNDIPIDVSGDFTHMRAEGDTLVIRNNIVVNFLDGSGSVSFDDGKLTYDNVHITIEDDELYGSGRLSVDIYDAGGGVHRARIDRVAPIIIEGEKSWGCIDSKDKCARSSEGADMIAFCLECPESILSTLQGHVNTETFDGFVFWNEEVNHLGELTPAATARGLVITNFGHDGPLVEGSDSDIQFDFHSLGEIGEDNVPLNDLEFTFLGGDEPEGSLGTIHNGNNQLTIEAQYDGSRFDGIHVVGSADKVWSSVGEVWKNFNPDGTYNDMEWEGLILDFPMTDSMYGSDDWDEMIAAGEELFVFTADGGGISVPAEEYYAMFQQWKDMATGGDFNNLETTLIHHDSFRYDPNTGENIEVENLYYTDGWDVVLEQRAVDRSGIFDMYLNVKFQERAWQEIADVCSECTGDAAILDDRCSSCSSRTQQEQLVHDRLEYLRSEIFVEQQRHEIHGLLEYISDPKHEGWVDDWFQAPVRRLFFGCGNVVNNQKATECLYKQLQQQEETLDTLQQIDELKQDGLSLLEIRDTYKFDEDFQKAFAVPSMNLLVVTESLEYAIQAGEETIIIDGEVIDISTPNQQLAVFLALQARAAESFSQQGFYTQAMEYNTMLMQTTGIASEDLALLFQSMDDITVQIEGGSPYGTYMGGGSQATSYYNEATSEIITIGGIEYSVPIALVARIEAGAFTGAENILASILRDGLAAKGEEQTLKTKEFVTELVPDTPFELALNLLPELYILGKTGIITKTATGLINWGKTATNALLMPGRIAAMSYLGIGGGWGFVDEAGEIILKYGDEALDLATRQRVLAAALELDLGVAGTNTEILRTVRQGFQDIPLTPNMLQWVEDGSTVLRFPDGSIVTLSPAMMDEWTRIMAMQTEMGGEIAFQTLTLNKLIDGEQVSIALGNQLPEVVVRFDTGLQGRIADNVLDDVLKSDSGTTLLELFDQRGLSLEAALTPESYRMVIEGAEAAGRADDPLRWLSDAVEGGNSPLSYCKPTECKWLGAPSNSPGHTHPTMGDTVYPRPSDPDLEQLMDYSDSYSNIPNGFSDASFIFSDAGITVVKRIGDNEFVNVLIPTAALEGNVQLVDEVFELMSDNGAAAQFYSGTVAGIDGDVGLRVWRDDVINSPHIDFPELVAEEIPKYQLLDNWGVGPEIHGEVLLPDGRPGLAMEIIDGDFPENVPQYINARTHQELAEKIAIIDSKGYAIGDFQYLVSPDGGVTIIDAGSMKTFDELIANDPFVTEGIQTADEALESYRINTESELDILGELEWKYENGIYIEPYE